ncbi:hypothetical protein GQ600_2472 [Phytophthora cactorum]|nr:hypothetical protein GQ600_2472 [Phytophthora cactorum]
MELWRRSGVLLGPDYSISVLHIAFDAGVEPVPFRATEVRHISYAEYALRSCADCLVCDLMPAEMHTLHETALNHFQGIGCRASRRSKTILEKLHPRLSMRSRLFHCMTCLRTKAIWTAMTTRVVLLSVLIRHDNQQQRVWPSGHNQIHHGSGLEMSMRSSRLISNYYERYGRRMIKIRLWSAT